FLGVSFVPDGDAGQCNGPAQSWVTNPNPTNAIRLDTDSRPGGCQLAFGIGDIDGSLAGLNITYQLMPHVGSDSGQCGSNWGVNQMPVGSSFQFGPAVRVDSDGRSGWCDLTFAMSGRNDVVLEVQFYADGDGGQCVNATSPGVWRAVTTGLPYTVGIDTDGRAGGCYLSLRLLKF
ncbi:MAG: hypothetical protein ABW215_22400, partial [Kibdelosporangium sp.]